MPFKRPLGERTADNQNLPNFIRPLQDKRVVVGQTVILECQVEGHPDPIIKWLKDGQNVTQCPDYEITVDGVKHRLIIKNVQAPDSGRFTAQAMNAVGTKQSTCTLIVAPAPTPIPGVKSVASSPGPPQTPVGPSLPIFLKQLNHQPLKPGAQVVLEARVVGNPTPQVEWLKNKSPLKNYRARTEYDPHSGICALIIPQMFADDIGEYTCRAINSNGIGETSAHLLPRDEYEKWLHEEQSLITKERKKNMLAQQGRLNSNSQKQHSFGRSVPTTQRQLQRRTPNGSSDPDSSADLPWGISESETEPELAAIDLHKICTPPVIQSPLRGLRLTEGTDAILQCTVIGYPKPRITWLKNRILLNPNISQRISMMFKGSTALLKIAMVSVEDSGEYMLIAENNFGQVQSKARVDVFPLQFEQPVSVRNFKQDEFEYQVQKKPIIHQQKFDQQRHIEEEERQIRQGAHYIQQNQNYYLPRVQQALYQQYPDYPKIHENYVENRNVERSNVNERSDKYYFGINEKGHYERAFEEDLHYRKYPREYSLPQYSFQQAPSPAQLNYQQQYQQQYQQHNPHQQIYQENPQKMSVMQKNALQQQQAKMSGQAFRRAPKPPQFTIVPGSNTVNSGENVTFEAKAFGDPPPQIEWMRSDGSKISSGGRIRTEVDKDGLWRLKIDRCTASDADTYLCIAKNSGGAVQTRHSLNVLEPRKSAAPQFVGKFQSVTINEGDSLTLYCKAAGERIRMSWSKDGTLLKTGGNYKIEDKGNGETTLVISGAKMADGGWYQCDATNDGGTSSLKGRVVVQSRQKLNTPREQITLRKVDRRLARDGMRRDDEMHAAPSREPPRFISVPKSFNLIEGQTALLDCQFAPADDPNLKIAWLLNEKALLVSSRISTVCESGYAALEINPVTVFDRGEYTVVAVNSLGEARHSVHLDVVGHRAVLSDSSNLDKFGSGYQSKIEGASNSIQIAEMPNFHSELRSMEVFEGDNIHLETKLSPSNDSKLKVEWFLNGNCLLANNRIKLSNDYGFVSLDLANISRSDAGLYTCRATNEIGVAETVATIIVQPRMPQYDEHIVQDVEDARELQYIQDKSPQAPVFLSQLRNCDCKQELGRSYFEARIAPFNDPTLKVIWLKDGRPLPNANRIQIFENFGCVSLTLHPTYPEDEGTYTCVLRNAYGEAQSSAHLSTMYVESLQTDSKHEQSLAQIGYLDSHEVHIGPPSIERPEEFSSIEPPRFARKLANRLEVNENDPVHFECRIQPASDVKMTVEWYHNGAPLAAAHRFRPMFDFGYVALDILYTYPEDSGTYTVIARNELGEIQCSLDLIVNSQKSLYLDPHHPEGLERIQELEQTRIRPLEHPADRVCDNPPRFLGDLKDLNLNENDNIHFDIKLQPINDPTMVVEWFINGHPILAGSRVKMQYDFGFITFDIRGAIAEDSGIYTLKATNVLGEATKECRVTVKPYATILSETQHQESLGKIQEIENLNRYGRQEVEDQIPQTAPQFVRPLPGNIGEIEEGTPLHLECQVVPLNDNTLSITWLREGKPIPTGHRFRTYHDFGFVSLDILDVYAEDTGTYICVAKNAMGEAKTAVSFTCKAKAAIIGQTNHPESVARIREIEAPKTAPEEGPEIEKQAPKFIKHLGDGHMIYVTEGDNVYLEAQIVPVDDNSLTYEWLLNGKPLMKAHRFVLSHDFGFVALNILYMYPEDSGTYELIIRNKAGEAKSVIDIDCAVKGNMITESFHPNSIQRIRELEMPLQKEEGKPEAPRQPPQIVRELPPDLGNIHESQTLHLEAQILPVDDNQLKVEWLHNGHPLGASSRHRLMNDFGFVSLDIHYIIEEDAGTYTLVVSNPAGKAETSTKFEVERLKSILFDTSHPESLRRIQEIESIQPAKPSEDEFIPTHPVFTQDLVGPTEVLKEGQSVHMDCMVQPINDPNLKIEWFLNGYPILFGSRIRTIHDFGYVGLEFLHVHPEDSGLYICKASNAAGEATTEFFMECKPRRNIYLETQHANSWVKIQEMENHEDIREPSPDMVFSPPTFIVPLQNIDGVVEGDRIRLECRLQPANDPTLKVYWTKNGQPLPEGSRFMPARNFDYVNLDLLAVYGEDSGVYSCRAISEFGEATTSCTIKCQPTDALLLHTQHEESWNRIQDIENRRPQEPIYEEPLKIAPNFVVPLPQQIGSFTEGSPIHVEAKIEPTNDNQLTAEWFHDGRPLVNAHRFRMTHDFGYVALDILYAFPEDSGQWECVVRNDLGEARSSAIFTVTGGNVILSDSQHPESWQRIQIIEAPREKAADIVELQHGPPKFTEMLQPAERIEGQPVHFETRVIPINDPKMQIQWFKDGAPLGNSNRFSHTSEFGYVALDIAYTIEEDSGTYAVFAINDEGKDQVETTLNVQPQSVILGDVQNERSWQKIQAIEQPKLKPEALPDVVYGPPHFVKQLNSNLDLIEGQPVHFEAAFEPIKDSNIVLTWYHNGRPLTASSRITMRNDFGLVSLDIHYVLPEDAGEFRCIISNSSGRDETVGKLQCQTRASILGDVLHAESWRRIRELEAPKTVPAAIEAPTYAKPTFTQPLQSVADVPEGSTIVLEARVIPVNDPKLQIIWFHNDAPLQQSSWHVISNDFGCVSLRISPVFSHHSGVYSCKAVNEQGTAVTSASLSVLGDDSLQLGSQHPLSLQKIQQLEALNKFPQLEVVDQEFGKPNWVKIFENIDDLQEGEIVLLNGFVEPVGDPSLRIEWYFNNAPMQNSNRYRHENDFGHVTLTIVHVLPQDSGVYTCRAINASGEAVTSATVKVAGYEAIVRSTQHPLSWEQIQILEAPAILEEVEDIDEKEKPRFLTHLESYSDVPEGDVIHLEATFQPARDPDLKVIWLLNGQPLGASQLIKTKSELGWATLDINGVNVDHSGVYTLKIINSEGEAASSASIKVLALGNILTDTSHEESWKKIQIIEAPKEKSPEPPAPVYEAPSIQTQIIDVECNEGEPSHFESIVAPTNDPNLQVLWFRNGQPLAHGSKYAISQDFGYCTLDIGYTYPEDQGIYQIRVINDAGEAVSSATLKCHQQDAILGDTQHEESWRRIQELETPKPEAPTVPPLPKTVPRFLTEIQNIGDLYEGQPAHFEATVEPVDDPDLKISWYLNGAPVEASSRIKVINDFGWVIFDINQTEPRDTGEWTCVAKNSAGEARCSAILNILGRDSIVCDPIQLQSLQRIQEIEAIKPLPGEPPSKIYNAPQITKHLQNPSDLAEGDSAHLEAQYTPIDDPKLKIEWFRNGQPLFHANRYKMVQDFGFAILDILHLFAQDAGQYLLKVSNNAGEATSEATLEIASKEGLILYPQNEDKARAVQQLEDTLHKKPEELILDEKKVVPVFIEPLSAPLSCEEGDRVHFTARYEPIDDNQLQILWFLNGKNLKTGSRVKTINDFGIVVLEIFPTYPEDSGEYTCRALNQVGEAVTSTQLTCIPREVIITNSQLPERMSGAYNKIQEIETPKGPKPDMPDLDHGSPHFLNQLENLPTLVEGQMAHLEVRVEPVADPNLKIEWFHNNKPVGHTSRMKTIHDFGYVVLELSPVEPQDSGTWKCRASNAKGLDEVSCEIQVQGTSGISYDWQSLSVRKERIIQLEDWIHRPKDDLDQPQQEYGAPYFTQNLEDLGQIGEANATAFTCVLEPIGDPSLQIEWQHNGHAVPYSNRIHMTNDFGVATLLIKHLISEDSGEYKCIAKNAKGVAETIGRVEVTSAIEIESPKIIQPLVQSIDGVEGEPFHLECRFTPINDSKLTVHWMKDGVPLQEASRFKFSCEFGFVTFDILYAYTTDTGIYECIAVNEKGEASTQATITVHPVPSLEFSPQAPGSNIENLESHMRQHTTASLALTKADAYVEALKRPPEFKTPLINIGIEEGEYCRFETQVAPVNDPYMKVEWFKDKKPVLIGHRFRSTLDFGFACLDVLYALPDDTGEYMCVATNRYGQASVSAKLACSATKHIITHSQLPQGVLVSDVKKLGDQPYWSDQTVEQHRVKQSPQFTIQPRNVQAVENEPARFECAVLGYPKPKVTWYINGNQALHGHRYKLNYDGIYYLTMLKTRISDAGEVVVIAKNSEGEVLASAMLDVFQQKDFRYVKLKPTAFKTIDELQEREIAWQKETLGQLGEAFENAPKPDQQKLVKVERSKSPIEPLESKELMEKFTRPKGDQFYNQINYVETSRPTFKGLELEPVTLKPGRIEKYELPKEEIEKVQLRSAPAVEKPTIPSGAALPQPSWAVETKLGDVEKRFNRLNEPEKEVNTPARNQVKLKIAKPKPAGAVPSAEHVEIEKERAKLASVVQGPEIPKEIDIPAKDQVTVRQKFKPKVVKPSETSTIESGPLKETPPVVKSKIEETTITSKPMPTKIGQTQKNPPQISTQLKPTQGEVGRSARFFCAFDGSHPMNVLWLKNGKEIKPSFEFQINTTNTGSTLNINKLKPEFSGEYLCRIENVAGAVESTASLTVMKPADRGLMPEFKQRINDVRSQQNASSQFSCVVAGTPEPTTSWFKDGKPLPNDDRYNIVKEGNKHLLIITDTLPQDGGIYECVAQNPSGEARCKARLNIILAKTGKGSEEGPKLQAPRFSLQIQPVAAQEGTTVEFKAKFIGSPEPTIRWYRNNEPIKKSSNFEISQSKDETTLRIKQCAQEHVAEYKCEATNPAGKASTVANLVLQPKSSSNFHKSDSVQMEPQTNGNKKSSSKEPPQFISRLTDISARPGHTVKFIAEISGNPQPTIAWQFNGRPLYGSRDNKIYMTGNKAVLEIQRTSHANAGLYIVTIRNPLGASQCQAKLTVENR